MDFRVLLSGGPTGCLLTFGEMAPPSPRQGADDLHAVSGSSGLPRVEVLKHLEHRLHSSGLPPASPPPPWPARLWPSFCWAASWQVSPPQAWLTWGGVWKAARGSRRPLWGSKLQWARGMVSEGAVTGRDLASVSPLVSDQMARVPLDSDSAGGGGGAGLRDQSPIQFFRGEAGVA